jgi:hypothetical protein
MTVNENGIRQNLRKEEPAAISAPLIRAMTNLTSMATWKSNLK